MRGDKISKYLALPCLFLWIIPLHIDIISMEFKWIAVEISINDIFLPLENVHILANSADPDEMPPYVFFFIWVSAVCESTNLGVTGLQRNIEIAILKLT